MPIELVMPSSHLLLCCPLLLLPLIPPSIRVFFNESALRMRWPKCWSFSFSISPSNEHPGLISFRKDWLDLLAVRGTLKSLLQHHSSKASILWYSAFFTVQLSHPYMHIHMQNWFSEWCCDLSKAKQVSSQVASLSKITRYLCSLAQLLGMEIVCGKGMIFDWVPSCLLINIKIHSFYWQSTFPPHPPVILEFNCQMCSFLCLKLSAPISFLAEIILSFCFHARLDYNIKQRKRKC